MKKIISSISLMCIGVIASAQACPQIEGLKPVTLRFAYNGNPETSIPVIPGYWNRIYKLDEITGQLVSVTCAFPCCNYFAYCVCFMTGTYFRRVTDVCDPTPCGGDLPLPGMPITNNNTSGSNWSLSTTWLANQVPDASVSASVVLAKSTQIDVDLNFARDHWLVLSGGNSSIVSGKTVTCNSVIQVYPAAQLENFGTLKGSGQIFGSLINSGTLSPGNSPGNFTITGNYTANSSAVHEIEIASKNIFDTISIAKDVSISSGNAILNGVLNVSLLNGFVPALGDTFKIFSFTSSTGGFASTSLPPLPQGLYWNVHYNPTNISLQVEAGTLPINFTKIKAYHKNTGVEVDWATENERNITIFEIERSVNGVQFNSAGRIKSNGTPATYQWFDANPSKGNNYYRIKAISGDGTVTYSMVQFIRFENDRAIILFPNPVKRGGILHLNLQNIVPATTIEIINTSGQLVYSNSSKQTGIVIIPISSSLPPGEYVLRMTGKNSLETQKIQIH